MLRFLFLIFVILAATKFIKSFLSKNSQESIKTREIAELFSFLQVKYDSYNKLTIHGCDITTLKFWVQTKLIIIQITNQDLINHTVTETTITLLSNTSMSELQNRINQEMSSFIEQYRSISPNKQITFIDYLQHLAKYEDISEYSNETLYVLEEIIETIEGANLNTLDITEDCELALANYEFLCNSIIDIKADFMELVTIYDQELSYRPLIELLEEIYEKANYISNKREEVVSILQYINEETLSNRYQEAMRG